MKVYGIYFEDGSMDDGACLLQDHIYLSDAKAAEVRDKLYNEELERKRKDFKNSYGLARDLEDEISKGYFGNLNPDYFVVELDVKE
jgi:hypothetical protein